MGESTRQLISELVERGIHLPPEAGVRIGRFGDSEALSDSLIELMLTGIKTGTCSLYWSWEYDGEALPKVGDLEVVLNWHERPMLVRRITKVEIVPFDEVTAEFAASEGEGDRSLAYWRKEHWRFFTEECTRIGVGRTADESMPLVCERFEVLYRV